MSLSNTTTSIYLSFLRPLALPRASTLQRFLSTATTTTAPPPPPPTSPTPTATELPYHVGRTASNMLPIYHVAKRGGNLKQTRVRKIEGDVALLREQLRTALGLDESEIAINPLTKHIIVKGWRRLDVARFLEERKF